MRRSYYNTNREEGEVLELSDLTAKSQEEEVLAFFRQHPEGKFARFQINDFVLPRCRYTSVQRAITNLTIKGYLEKLGKEDMIMDPTTGKMVHRWRLRRRPPEEGGQFLFNF